MSTSASAQCRACITTLKITVSTLSDTDRQKGEVKHEQVNDELERFSLWIGNIGALHGPESPMSLESRLRESSDVLAHILELLDDLNEVVGELFEIVSEAREGKIAPASSDGGDGKDQNEVSELLEEIGACITRLFRVSRLIRQAAPTDLFAKAISRNRYHFNDQFDIAHVGEKYPQLATKELAWLQKRLGRAITQRRRYLSYIHDHHEKLESVLTHEETSQPVPPISQAHTKQFPARKILPDSSSQPSTFFTKASSLTPGYITPQMLSVEEESDPENDARSYTTISRSIDDDLDCSTTVKIPKLDSLRRGSKKEFECPFCYRMKKFKNERVWRRHVFSDLRSYICTFPDCDAPYFGDINEWFRHEMQAHRVSYICPLCQGKTFQLRERYLAHVRKQHPDIMEDGEEQTLLDISRKPLDQIPAQECPCCSEWVDRLKKRAAVTSIPSDPSDHILCVVPTVFKRHLASHLEQLALFAVPIGSATEGEVDSNVAIEQHASTPPVDSDLATLTFESPRPSSPASNEQSSDNIPIIEGTIKGAGSERSDSGYDQKDEYVNAIETPEAKMELNECTERFQEAGSGVSKPTPPVVDYTSKIDPHALTRTKFRLVATVMCAVVRFKRPLQSPPRHLPEDRGTPHPRPKGKAKSTEPPENQDTAEHITPIESGVAPSQPSPPPKTPGDGDGEEDPLPPEDGQYGRGRYVGRRDGPSGSIGEFTSEWINQYLELQKKKERGAVATATATETPDTDWLDLSDEGFERNSDDSWGGFGISAAEIKKRKKKGIVTKADALPAHNFQGISPDGPDPFHPQLDPSNAYASDTKPTAGKGNSFAGWGQSWNTDSPRVYERADSHIDAVERDANAPEINDLWPSGGTGKNPGKKKGTPLSDFRSFAGAEEPTETAETKPEEYQEDSTTTSKEDKKEKPLDPAPPLVGKEEEYLLLADLFKERRARERRLEDRYTVYR